MSDFNETKGHFKQKFGRCLNRIIQMFSFKLLALGMELPLGNFSINFRMRYYSKFCILDRLVK